MLFVNNCTAIASQIRRFYLRIMSSFERDCPIICLNKIKKLVTGRDLDPQLPQLSTPEQWALPLD